MKKKMWLTLCNIGVSVVFLLSLYSYTKGMRLFSLGLAMALLIEIGIRGLIEQKFAQEAAEVNGNKIYYVSEILRYACAIILAIAVWRNGFKWQWLKNGTPHSHISIIISITPGKNDGDNDKMKEIIEYSTKNDFRYLEKSEVIF